MYAVDNALVVLFSLQLTTSIIQNKRRLYLLRRNLAEYPQQNQELLLCQCFWPKKKQNKFSIAQTLQAQKVNTRHFQIAHGG